MNQIKLFFFALLLNSCVFGNVNSLYNTSYNLPSVGESSSPSSSEYFYFDVDETRYRSERDLPPYYEISTTEEYGDSESRDSVSNCEIKLVVEDEDNGVVLSEPTETLVCILDLLEGDLQVKDLHLTFNFPAGMCSYIRTGLPWHFNHQILPGPYVDVDETVNCDEDGNNCETRYCDKGSENGSCDCGNNNPDCEMNEEDLCPSNGSGEETFKCCSGGKKTGGESWEPDIKCFGGPALVAKGDTALPAEDFDIDFVRELPEGGLKEDFTLPNIIDLNGGEESMTHANYVKALDLPAEDLKNVERTDLPVFLQESPGGTPRLFFEFDCLDAGSESLHKILVMIREWNTLEEFWDFYTDGGNDSADPDVDGEEGDDCEYEDRTSIAGEPGDCNDERDMDDIPPPDLDLEADPQISGYPEID